MFSPPPDKRLMVPGRPFVHKGRPTSAAASVLAAVDPATVAGRVVHYDANAEAYANNAAVTTLTDQSGNTRNATQATAGKQPTFKTAIWNSKPVYRLDGGDGLNTAAVNLTAGDTITVYAVVSATDELLQTVIESSDDYSGNAGAFRLAVLTTRNAEMGITGATGNNVFRSAATVDVTTTPRIVTGRIKMGWGHQETYVAVDGHHTGSHAGVADNSSNLGNHVFNVGCRDADGTTLSTNFLAGDLGELIVYTGFHDAATQANIEAWLAAKWGVSNYAVPTGNMVFEIDSLTNGGNSYYAVAYPTRLLNRLKDRYAYANPSVNGRTLATATTAIAEATALSRTEFGTKNITVVWGGTNDMITPNGAASAATTLARLWTYCDTVRATGAKVVVGTCLPRSDANAPGDFNTKRATLNAGILSAWTSHADILSDPAANTNIGDDGDSDVLTYYDADKVHLNAAGYRLVSQIHQAAIHAVIPIPEVVPTDISGLVGWWEADQLALTNNDPVSSWTDASGNGRHATATGTARPTYLTNIKNGQPVVRFDGIANILATASIDLTGTQAVTLIVVGAGSSSGDHMACEFSTNYNLSTTGFNLLQSGGNPSFGARGNVNYINYDPGAWGTGWAVLSGVFDYSRAAREAVAWNNGVLSGSRGDANNTGFFGNNVFHIGARGSGPTLFFSGDIAAILLYNRALRGEERNRLEERFATKYGVY